MYAFRDMASLEYDGKSSVTRYHPKVLFVRIKVFFIYAHYIIFF